MIVFQMKMLTKDGQALNTDEYDTLGLWCKVETEEEWLVYDKTFHKPFNPASATKSLVQGIYIDLWNEMVKHAGAPYLVNLGDEDIYGYLSPDEDMPDLNEKYRDADDNDWVRI